MLIDLNYYENYVRKWSGAQRAKTFSQIYAIVTSYEYVRSNVALTVNEPLSYIFCKVLFTCSCDTNYH